MACTQDSPLSQYVKAPISRVKRRLLILTALGVAVMYVAAAVATDASKTRDALLQLGWVGCVAVLALSVVNYTLRFYRWQYFLARLGHKLPTQLHFLYYLSGFAFTLSPAKAGEAFRSIHLSEHGVAYSESLAALFAERLLDLVAMCLLATLIALDHAAYRPLIAGAMAVAVVVLYMSCHPYLPRRLQSLADSGRHGVLARPLATMANLLRSSQRVLQPKATAFGVAIGLVSWGAEGIGLYLICLSLGIQVGISAAIGIYAIASLAGSAAFFLPAGIGGMEIVMSTLLVTYGAPLRTAVVATLLCRIATLWFAVILGVAASALAELRPAPPPIRSES
jgi:glycosyltransferase 2 family protein